MALSPRREARASSTRDGADIKAGATVSTLDVVLVGSNQGNNALDNILRYRRHMEDLKQKELNSVLARIAGETEILETQVATRKVYADRLSGRLKGRITVSDIREHRIEEEYFTINKKTVEFINRTKENYNKIFGVGTTVMRSLESANYKHGKLLPTTAISNIFIYPGYQFKSNVDALITNFHIPRSTLIMLVSAFAGYNKIKKAYQIAIKEKYNFFSFGDAMLIYPTRSFPDML
jgi:hypothetical protein